MRHKIFMALLISTTLVGCSNPSETLSITPDSSTTLDSPISSTSDSSNSDSSSIKVSTSSNNSSSTSSNSSSTSSTTTETYVPVPSDYFENKHYTEDESMKTNKVEIASVPSGYKEYEGFEAYVSGIKMPLYNVLVNRNHVFASSNYNRADSAVGIMRLEGKTTYQVRCPFKIETVSVKPTGSGIVPIIDNAYNVISFEITSAGQYTVEINGPTEHVLHLFVDGVSDNYDSYKGQSNVIYFGPGLYNKSNDSRINANNEIVLSSNQTLFLDYGAVVQAKIVANNADSVKVVGGGIVDGSVFERNATTGARAIPFDFNFCTNTLVKGISFLDPAGWCMNIYFNEYITIDNVKIITSRANGDGISLQSTQHAVVKRCFVRSFDDSIVVKNYPKWSNRDEEGTTKDIVVSDCIIWTDLAQSLEIGYECVGTVMEDIHFEDITIIHNFHKPALSIHNSNNADLKKVTYTNITIDDPSMGLGDGYSTLIEINAKYSPTWSSVQKTTALGKVSNVTVTNLLVRGEKEDWPIVIEGSLETRSGYESAPHYVEGVYLTDISIGGKKINNPYKGLVTNSYARGVYISQNSGVNVTGASLYADPLQESLSGYGRNVIVSTFR